MWITLDSVRTQNPAEICQIHSQKFLNRYNWGAQRRGLNIQEAGKLIPWEISAKLTGKLVAGRCDVPKQWAELGWNFLPESQRHHLFGKVSRIIDNSVLIASPVPSEYSISSDVALDVTTKAVQPGYSTLSRISLTQSRHPFFQQQKKKA